ncbi:MAG: hypothetical protein NTX78_06300 [Rhodoluna sp.]|nr:hypothetical protein [Rhodoluna sp.]
MAQPRLRRCTSQQEMERVIDDMAIQGYKIKARSETSALMQKNDYGSILIHIILLFFTFGIGNIVYALVKNSNSEKIALRVNEDEK